MKSVGAVAMAVESLDAINAVSRLWERDHTLWSDDPAEIADRLGWLDISDAMRAEIGSLTDFARQVRDEGVGHIVLLGMGGSALGAEVLSQSFGPVEGRPELIVLDSTLPARIKRVAGSVDIARTLFVVSSKSGSTTEPNLLYRYFRRKVDKLSDPGRRFIAITDSGSPLECMARREGFREIFLNAPDVCGRYSVLSYFGLAPAALAGYDIEGILDSAEAMRSGCAARAARDNPGAWLGASIASLYELGRDKLTILTSPTLSSFGLWIEQLVAESLGKDGKGIVPIVDEPAANPRRYAADRQFVYLKLAGDDSTTDELADALELVRHPLIRYEIPDISALGGEFYRWEFAVAIAAALMGVHPFSQPDVQLAKELTRRALESSGSCGKALTPKPHGSPAELIAGVEAGDYMAILAYVPQTRESDDTLSGLREAILDKYRIPTTLGYGPRYLHSTGQLHKGGPNNVAVLVITSAHKEDIDIPEENFTFGALSDAQAAADIRALRDAGRRTACVALSSGSLEQIRLKGEPRVSGTRI